MTSCEINTNAVQLPNLLAGTEVRVRRSATPECPNGSVEAGWIIMEVSSKLDGTVYYSVAGYRDGKMLIRSIEASELEALQEENVDSEDIAHRLPKDFIGIGKSVLNTFSEVVETFDEADRVHDTIPQGIAPIRSETPTFDAVVRLKDSSVAEKLQREAALTHQRILSEEKDFLTAINALADCFVKITYSLYSSPEEHLVKEIEAIVDSLRDVNPLSWDSGYGDGATCSQKELAVMGLLLTIAR